MPLLKVKPLPLGDVFQDTARVALEHRPHTKAGRVIVISVGGKTARALARGEPARDDEGIYLDDATRDRLGISVGQTLEFTIARAGLWDEFWWAWQATNVTVRVSAKLGIVSVFLGLLGLGLGAIALWLTIISMNNQTAIDVNSKSTRSSANPLAAALQPSKQPKELPHSLLSVSDPQASGMDEIELNEATLNLPC